MIAFHTWTTQQEVLNSNKSSTWFMREVEQPGAAGRGRKWRMNSAADITWFALHHTDPGVSSHHHKLSANLHWCLLRVWLHFFTSRYLFSFFSPINPRHSLAVNPAGTCWPSMDLGFNGLNNDHKLNFIRFISHQMDYSLFAGAGDVSWYSVFTVHDHGEGLTVVSFLEGRLATYQHEQDHTQTPDIWGNRDTQRNTILIHVDCVSITAAISKKYL